MKVFEFNASKGETIDQVSKTIPTNTNVVFKRTEKGRAASFDGTADLNYGNLSDLNFIDGDFSVSYISKDIGSAENQRIISNGEFIVAGWEVFDSSGTITVRSYQSGTQNSVIGNYTEDSLYHQGTITRTGATVNIYVDNVLIISSVAFVSPANYSGNAIIGRLESGGYNHIGCIPSLKIYNHVLTTQEREALYQKFLNTQTIESPVVTNRDTTVGNFDGQTNSILITSATGIINGEFTWMAWIKPNTILGYDTVISRNTSQGLYLKNGELNYFYLSDNLSGASVVANKWQHIVVRRNADDTLSFFIDTIEATNHPSMILDGPSTDLRIGNDLQATTFFDGSMSDVRLYGTALSDAEISTARNGLLVGSENYVYKLNEKGGTTAFDSIGSNNGTWTNATNQYTNSRLNTILNSDGTNWNADGVTQSNFVGDFKIDSGTFKVEEDTTGKKITCVTNGTLKYQGLDLSEFVGNGYIERIDGDLSSDAGDTVDNATNVSFASNELSIAMTAGQILRNMTITRGV